MDPPLLEDLTTALYNTKSLNYIIIFKISKKPSLLNIYTKKLDLQLIAKIPKLAKYASGSGNTAFIYRILRDGTANVTRPVDAPDLMQLCEPFWVDDRDVVEKHYATTLRQELALNDDNRTRSNVDVSLCVAMADAPSQEDGTVPEVSDVSSFVAMADAPSKGDATVPEVNGGGGGSPNWTLEHEPVDVARSSMPVHRISFGDVAMADAPSQEDATVPEVSDVSLCVAMADAPSQEDATVPEVNGEGGGSPNWTLEHEPVDVARSSMPVHRISFGGSATDESEAGTAMEMSTLGESDQSVDDHDFDDHLDDHDFDDLSHASAVVSGVDTKESSLLCLLMSYPSVPVAIATYKARHPKKQSLSLEHARPSVQQAVECLDAGILHQQHARDLARLVATEQCCGMRAYTVSLSEQSVRADRHLMGNMKAAMALCTDISTKWPKLWFDQVVMDYYWIPSGWLRSHIGAQAFVQLLRCIPGLLNPGASVLLPFSIDVFECFVKWKDKLDEIYEVFYLDAEEVAAQCALVQGTNTIDANTMSKLGKPSNQEIYASITTRSIQQQHFTFATTEDVLSAFLNIDNGEKVRMIRLTLQQKVKDAITKVQQS
jgi:hypothetical protein